MRSVCIHSSERLNLDAFLHELDVPVRFEFEGYDEERSYYYFSRPGISTTLFVIAEGPDEYEVMIDGLASYSDYKFFPYLVDCLCQHLNHESLVIPESAGRTAYRVYDESWIEDSIGEEVAMLKSALSVFPRYYVGFPLEGVGYISLDLLAQYGVNLHSSTPRIYGYIQYIMRNGLLPQATDAELEEDRNREDQETEVDVPQHISIGRVKSWQIDGAETWESYSREDTEMLLKLGEDYQSGREVAGVVLNDLGTIYQEGIGVGCDGLKAEYWFKQAYLQGDHLYAPTNLGDLYRKGCGELPSSLPLAFEAYRKSEDIYALYRIGQAYEEGWTGTPDMEKALFWYRKAAEKRHHLAVRRLEELSSSACMMPRNAR